MIKSKILYLILLIISIVFFILYALPLSLYLLIFIAVLPVIMGSCIIIAKKFVKADLKMNSDTIIKNEKISFNVSIYNRTPIPFPNNVITVEYCNKLLNVSETMTINVPVHSFGCEKVNFSLVSDFCGILNVKVKSVRIYDYIKLFSCRIKPEHSCNVTVLPEIYPINSNKSFSMINAEDSDIFSKHKSGDDPSEIFALKDYVPGDKPNRIHWNLSLKQDQLIIRHYSQPINSSILLILDFCGNSGYNALSLDTAAETAFSISFFLTDNEVPFKFAYYSNSMQNISMVDIKDEKDISVALKEIFMEGPAEKTDFPKRIKELLYSYSNIFYITTSTENLYETLHNNALNENFHPIFIQDENNNINNFEKLKELTVIPAGQASQFISDVL